MKGDGDQSITDIIGILGCSGRICHADAVPVSLIANVAELP
jgi:hypothetical protein